MELQASPTTTSRSSQFSAEETVSGLGGFAVPGSFPGDVRRVACEMILIFLSRFLAGYYVRRGKYVKVEVLTHEGSERKKVNHIVATSATEVN